MNKPKSFEGLNNRKVIRAIPFVQYIRPHGAKETSWTIDPSYDEALLQRAQEILDADFTFTIELLNNNRVCLTISDDHADYASRVVPNDKSVVTATRELIMSYTVAELETLRNLLRRGRDGELR